MRTLNKIQIILLAVVMVTIPFSAYGTDGQRKISQTPLTTFPITINQSGSYVLTSNLVVTDPNVNAIEITVNDVTLDLNGHTIQGPNTGSGTGSGIYASERFSIAIKNGRIWGFGGDGIYLSAPTLSHSYSGAGHCVDKIQAANNGSNGILLRSGLVTNCTANNNGVGIFTSNATVTNCIANKNVYNGFNCQNSTLTNCTASYNGDMGINALSCTVTACMAFSNITAGFQGINSIIINCTAYGNDGMGITAYGSTITNCTISYNSSNGISLESKNLIEGNNLRNNGSGGSGYGLNITGDNNYAVRNMSSANASGNFQDSGTNNFMPFAGDNANYWIP